MARLYIGKRFYKVPESAVAEFRKQYRQMMEEESLDGRHTGNCQGRELGSPYHVNETGSCICPEVMAVEIFEQVLPVFVAKMRRAVRRDMGCNCECPRKPSADWGLCRDCIVDSAEYEGFLEQLRNLL